MRYNSSRTQGEIGSATYCVGGVNRFIRPLLETGGRRQRELVDSVTSTCLRSSVGDMRDFSAPILPVSSGAWPGQSSTTSGLSAATTGQATHNQVTRENLDARDRKST